MRRQHDLLAISLLMLTAVLSVWLGLAGPIANNRAGPGLLASIKEWQTFVGMVVGGGITVTGIFVAAANVSRQMRMNLMSREEDRMEQALPGLYQAKDFLGGFRNQIRDREPYEILTILKSMKLENYESVQELVSKELSHADAETRQAVEQGLQGLLFNCDDCVIREGILPEIDEWLAEHPNPNDDSFIEKEFRKDYIITRNLAMSARRFFNVSRDHMNHLYAQVTLKEMAYCARIPKFRAQIERFFDS
jgi:hypothetical protein